jgi:hypothetical protein
VTHNGCPVFDSLGPAVIPFLPHERENRTGHWHRARRRISGADPVRPAEWGNINKMAAENGEQARKARVGRQSTPPQKRTSTSR